ncbi:MAG TPA: hypothetical protein VFY31_08540 [Macromonas sp.]|nr:hypothetical protein [Macromonas sp.]
MPAFHALTSRHLPLLAAMLFVAPLHALAQAPAAAPAPAAAVEPKSEHITHEDAGSRIEELRVGGQTRSIDVQPKTDVPGYQVKPIDPTRTPEGSGPGATPEGKSSWRLLNF